MENVQGKIFGAAIATLIAILSGLGVGSGGLLVIWLTLALGVDAQMARGLNLLFFDRWLLQHMADHHPLAM